jgi:hypothetical protein
MISTPRGKSSLLDHWVTTVSTHLHLKASYCLMDLTPPPPQPSIVCAGWT